MNDLFLTQINAPHHQLLKDMYLLLAELRHEFLNMPHASTMYSPVWEKVEKMDVALENAILSLSQIGSSVNNKEIES